MLLLIMEKKMSDYIELWDWACWKFGHFEYRLCGYNNARCIITEPILGVNVEGQFVETTNNIKFKLHEPIHKSQMIDMMYILDRWMNLNLKGKPGDSTDMVLEALGRITADGKAVERKEDVPHEETTIESNEGAKTEKSGTAKAPKRKTKNARVKK